ncbi:MAG TPA: adenylate/guanylate cyclase domain-containing protein, partial [Anaerolineae bacterium]|nr:adenylate/guanylate cyclase domain-containing protein [Anaerolineae bacterium]
MTLTSQLSALESSGLIQLAQTQPEVEYHFRHALVQDATYASLLKADRKHLHEKVGSILEQLYPEQLKELAPLLGHHFAEAGADEPAIKYLSLAGDVAAGRYANAEAIIHYTRAIEIARHSPHVELSAHLFSQRGRALELSGRF